MAEEEHTDLPYLSPFDAIRHTDEQGEEHWSARELYRLLGYTEWRNFNNTVIKRAIKACEENGEAASFHFVRSYKNAQLGQGNQRRIEDILLSRYAAYLVVMNGDPKLPVVAITKQKLERDQVQGKEQANQIHYQVGKKVRQTIDELGGTMPEDLPTPKKSIQQLQREEQKRIVQQQQPSLFLLEETSEQ